jgi:hypothetical protein
MSGPVFEFHISGKARELYNFEKGLFSGEFDEKSFLKSPSRIFFEK